MCCAAGRADVMHGMHERVADALPDVVARVLPERVRLRAEPLRELFFVDAGLPDVRLRTADVVVGASELLALGDFWSDDAFGDRDLVFEVVADLRRRSVVDAVDRVAVVEQVVRFAARDFRNPFVPELTPPFPRLALEL